MTGVTSLVVRIPGTPRTQGSAALAGGRMYKKASEKSHRELAVWLMRKEWAGVRIATGPVRVDIRAEFHRPAAHYRTGRFAADLKPSAPHTPHAQKPDADKIGRLICDALTLSRVIADDAQVSELRVEKRWIPRGEESGTTVTLTAVDILTAKGTHHDQ